MEVALTPLRTTGGDLVMAAVRDASPRLRAEQRFKDLLDAAPDATPPWWSTRTP